MKKFMVVLILVVCTACSENIIKGQITIQNNKLVVTVQNTTDDILEIKEKKSKQIISCLFKNDTSIFLLDNENYDITTSKTNNFKKYEDYDRDLLINTSKSKVEIKYTKQDNKTVNGECIIYAYSNNKIIDVVKYDVSFNDNNIYTCKYSSNFKFDDIKIIERMWTKNNKGV